eukprot:scaffold20565_cov51-Phaeocystis_antarctica.AAC.2
MQSTCPCRCVSSAGATCARWTRADPPTRTPWPNPNPSPSPSPSPSPDPPTRTPWLTEPSP